MPVRIRTKHKLRQTIGCNFPPPTRIHNHMKKYLAIAILALATGGTLPAIAQAQDPTAQAIIAYLEQQRVLDDYGRSQGDTHSRYTDYYQWRQDRRDARRNRQEREDAQIMHYFGIPY
jgi:hypothetical protein